MDKKGVTAMRKVSIFLALVSISLVFFCSGCETIKGAAEGAGRDIKNLAGAGDTLDKVDKWMRENMW